MQAPAYRAAGLAGGIVHLGVGGFARSHLFGYTHELLQAQPAARDWGIVGVGLTPADAPMRDAMAGQDCLYNLIARESDRSQVTLIGSMHEYIFAPDRPADVLNRIGGPEARIVSVTVTEKGYCHRPETGELDLDNPAVRADLDRPDAPASLPGVLLAGLGRRMQAGLPGLTVLSCDNLQDNGRVVRAVVSQLAEAQGNAQLGRWIEEHCSFPCSMVDRITPATSEEDKQWLREQHNLDDRWPVVCEQFRQWVLADEFVNGRPEWEAVGAMFVADVYPYELLKLRLLNSSHSALAYPAYLLGHTAVDQAMADCAVDQFVAGYMDEAALSCLPVPGLDVEDYKKTLRRRFGNSGVKDQVLRLAEDGSTKIANQMVPIVLENLQAGAPTGMLQCALAGFIRFMSGTDPTGQPIPIKDPKADLLQPLASEAVRTCSSRGFVGAAFGAELAAADGFVGGLDEALRLIDQQGMRAALDKASSNN